MKSKPLPDKNTLEHCLDYDPLTGALTWKVRPEWTFLPQEGRTPRHIANAWNAAWAGKPAFTSIAKNGYLKGAFNGENFYAHRIIFKLVYGIEPDDIDHDDGVRSNNRLKNLIDKNRSGNLKNRCLSSNNTSGFHGVSWNKRLGYWGASIYHEGKKKHLGWFKYKQDAVIARKEAEIKYNYHPNHGRL